MRKAMVIAYVVLHVGIAILSMTQMPEVMHSALWSVDAGIAALIITGPILAGYGAVDSYLLRRAGVEDLVTALPLRAQVKMHMLRALRQVSLGAATVAVSVLVGLAIAAVNGSYLFDFSVILLALPTLGILLLYVAVGRLIGYALPYAATSLVVAVGLYSLAMFFPGVLRIFYGFTAPNITYLSHYEVSPALVLCAAYTAIAVTAFITLIGLVRASKVLQASGLVLLSLALFTLGRLHIDNIWLQSDDIEAQQWVCGDLEVDDVSSSVCIPRDQKRDLDLLRDDLSKTVQQLAYLDAELILDTYNAPGDPSSNVDFPMGNTARDASNSVGSIIDSIPRCDDPYLELDMGDEEAWDVLEQSEQLIAEWLIRVPSTHTPDPEEIAVLRDALTTIRGCSS